MLVDISVDNIFRNMIEGVLSKRLNEQGSLRVKEIRVSLDDH